MAKGIALAATAALLGALVWMGVAYLTSYEYHIIAFGIGIVVGLATMIGFDREVGPVPMTTALVFTALSIMGGRYFAIELLWDEYQSDAAWQEEAQRAEADEEYAITYMADAILNEYRQQGKPLNFPLLANQDFPESSKDYPTDVWNDAVDRWSGMDQAQRESFLSQSLQANREYVDSISDEMKGDAMQTIFEKDNMVLILIASVLSAMITRAAPNEQADAIDDLEA